MEQKKSYRGIEQVREAGGTKKKAVSFYIMTRAVSVGSQARLNQAQNWSCFVSNLTNPINKMFMRLIYLKSPSFLGLIIVDINSVMLGIKNRNIDS